jgi:hypothetical protein
MLSIAGRPFARFSRFSSGRRKGVCGLSSLDVKPFDKLRAKQQLRVSIRPARLAPTAIETYCKSHVSRPPRRVRAASAGADTS